MLFMRPGYKTGGLFVVVLILALAPAARAQRGRGGMRGTGRAGGAYFGRIAPRYGRAYFGPLRRYPRRRFIFPIWWGGALDYADDCDYLDAAEPCDYPYYNDDEQSFGPEQTQAAPIIIEFPPTAPAPPVTESQSEPQEPDLAPLVLVRRDGQVLKAVAFTIAGDRVTYVTPEGARRSFAVAELDEASTREKNDIEGATVALPH